MTRSMGGTALELRPKDLPPGNYLLPELFKDLNQFKLYQLGVGLFHLTMGAAGPPQPTPSEWQRPAIGHWDALRSLRRVETLDDHRRMRAEPHCHGRLDPERGSLHPPVPRSPLVTERERSRQRRWSEWIRRRYREREPGCGRPTLVEPDALGLGSTRQEGRLVADESRRDHEHPSSTSSLDEGESPRSFATGRGQTLQRSVHHVGHPLRGRCLRKIERLGRDQRSVDGVDPRHRRRVTLVGRRRSPRAQGSPQGHPRSPCSQPPQYRRPPPRPAAPRRAEARALLDALARDE